MQAERRSAKADQGLSPIGQLAVDWWPGGTAASKVADQTFGNVDELMSRGEDTEDEDDMQSVLLDQEDKAMGPAQGGESSLPIRQR